MINFPRKFLWGAATSSYQVEGGNSNCDWWVWEKGSAKAESASACRHYELYKEDFDLAKALGHNAHRFSIEWSRIEPRQGEFSEPEIAHYKDVILSLRERNIEPVITLHHFTNPLWFSKSGGWLNKKSCYYFLRYTEKIIEAFGGNVRYWITINEPSVYIYYSYILGDWPPQEKSLLKAGRVQDNMAIAHIKAYRLIHSMYKARELPAPDVSFSMNMQSFISCKPNLKNKVAGYIRDKLYNRWFVERIVKNKALDFIGLNYYSRTVIDVKKWGIGNLLFDTCRENHHQVKKNCLGWDIYPDGLHQLLLALNRYNLPIFITENGICTDDDNQRWEFIRDHLKNISFAMDKGVKVLGYLYWSLIDNFEWDKGFTPRFGLIEMDYNTYKRVVRNSAWKFAEVCKTGMLEENR